MRMNIGDFSSLGKKKEVKKNENKGMLVYTRVSSKDQESNKSLIVQLEQSRKFASANKFEILGEFGGTYESASGDFTRKEFSRLINHVRSMKDKPYGILLNTINRFSRTGGSGVALATDLVESMGVHLFDVSTGKDTTTEEGKLEIYRDLLKARQENLDRMKHTLPGMEKYLREGNWLGVAPRGYDQYGPKVKDMRLYSPKQKIVINHEGELLKKAWRWKLEGEKDFMIIQKLAELGLKLSKQAVSDMWRNPFYTGLIAHKLLDGDVVKGNWEFLVKPYDFLVIKEMLKVNNVGYKQDKTNPNRPLTGFVRCECCGNKFTGYEVKSKGLHYYKCQECIKGSINADTTIKSKLKGANNLFQDLLSNIQLTDDLKDLFQKQLRYTYESLTGESEQENTIIYKNLEKSEKELKELKIRNVKGLIDDIDIYNELKMELEEGITELKQKLNNQNSQISNLDKFIDYSVSISSNISNFWSSSDINTKKRIQELVFPEGITLDIKNRRYLTKKTNIVFEISSAISRVAEGKNENGSEETSEPSSLVEWRTRISNHQFCRDLTSIAHFYLYLIGLDSFDSKSNKFI